MSDMICAEGWAHDPIMRGASCDTPVVTAHIMAAANLLIILNLLRFYGEVMWRMRRLHLHRTQNFLSYIFMVCVWILWIPQMLPFVLQAGLQPYSPGRVWCFGVAHMCVSLGIVSVTDHKTRQTVSLMFALDPHKGSLWKYRLRCATLGLSAMIVGCFTLVPMMLNSSVSETRHRGAALLLLAMTFIMTCNIGITMLVRREQKAIELKMGQRSAGQLASGLKSMKITVIAISVLLGPNLVIAFTPRLREMAGLLYLFFLLPVSALLFTMVAAAKAKKCRSRMAAASTNLQIIPVNVCPAVEDQHSIASTVIQSAHSELPRSKITVRESGVTLRFLEQFYAENQISEGATANDVVNQHVKPHTKDIGGQGSGPFVELIQTGETNGVRWCGVPTHMVSYSWKYTLATMLDVLGKFELDRPAISATPHRYYIDQFALDQHSFGNELGSEKEVQAMMLETLNESIAVPGKMLCMLHPW
jgi:hypothetical protein